MARGKAIRRSDFDPNRLARLVKGIVWLDAAHARLALLCTLAASCALGAPAAAQTTWDLTPYRVQVFVAAAPDPELTPVVRVDLIAGLTERTDCLVGAPWDFSAAAAPEALARDMVSSLETVSWQLLPRETLKCDKIILVVAKSVEEVSSLPKTRQITHLSYAPYEVTAREFDTRTRLWGPVVSGPVWQLAKLRNAALDAMFAAFVPLARIDSVDKQRVVLRPKAAALRARNPQLLAITPGDLFRPVIRDDDRHGNPLRILPVPWTFLTVEKIAGGQAECDLQSGLRSPLSARRRSRRQQLALAVVPPRRASVLTLQSRAAPKQPLAGYEIYAQPPGTQAATLVGQTDQQGRITVPPGEPALQTLLVQHGGQLLARLPIVPGIEPELTAEIASDDPRLEAEGLVNGLQEELVDLVTRRELLLARAKTRIKAQQFDQARQLIDELGKLPTAPQYALVLAEQKKRLASNDRAVQEKIDALLGDTQKLVAQHLDPAPLEEIRQQLRSAERLGGRSQGDESP